MSVAGRSASTPRVIAGALCEDEEIHAYAAGLAGQQGGLHVALHGPLLQLGAVGLRHVIVQGFRHSVDGFPHDQALTGDRRTETRGWRLWRHHAIIREAGAEVSCERGVRRANGALEESSLPEGGGV